MYEVSNCDLTRWEVGRRIFFGCIWLHDFGEAALFSSVMVFSRSGDMVVMSMDAYESMAFESEVYTKLCEAEMQSQLTGERLTPEDVDANLRETLRVAGLNIAV